VRHFFLTFHGINVLKRRHAMRLSRYVHCVPLGPQLTAWYHALKIKTVFVSPQFARGVNRSLRRMSRRSPYAQHWPALEVQGMIVDSEERDARLLEQARATIAPPAIAVMYLMLTDHCNFACRYCFVENRLPGGQGHCFMTQETAAAAVDYYAKSLERSRLVWRNPKQIVTFYGGEPLLNESVFRSAVQQLTDYKRDGKLPESVTLSLITNGSCLSAGLATFIREHGVNVSVSLDGSQEATDLHRRDRGGLPVFDRVMQGIEELRAAQVPVGISCTINARTLADPQETIDFLTKTAQGAGVGFNIIMRDSAVELPADYETQASRLILAAFDQFRQRGIYEDRIMRKVKAFAKQGVYPFDCSAAGANQIVVAPDGAIGICHGYIGSRKHFVGSVFDSELIVEQTPVYQEWHKRSPLYMPQCQECIALGICGGGCPCNAELAHGSIWELDERFCTHAKMTLEWLIRDLWTKISERKGKEAQHGP
jgi:uncharacterized protein